MRGDVSGRTDLLEQPKKEVRALGQQLCILAARGTCNVTYSDVACRFG